MDSAEEVAPMEEVVKALLDYLVDPMLPLKASGKDPPLATQESVAKQMHAVVLLYNYYHREENPGLEFLEFGAFCKLAVSLKPALKAHMKLAVMQQTDLTGSDEMENPLSVTEKAVKDACKISSCLIALKDFSITEGWPVSKVSVLLVDSNKENCLLLFSSITNGAWSLIEKHLGTFDHQPESLSDGKRPNKRKKMGANVLTDEESNGELAFRQCAFSAVEEATGINQSGLVVLDRHVVYSLSEENMVAYFYIMQCTQSSNEDIQVPITDVIESLQGPLLKRISGSWTLTPKIEYYNVLPYAQIMSCWLSRQGFSSCSRTLNFSSPERTGKVSKKEAAEIEKFNLNGLHNFNVELGNVNFNSSQGLEKPCDGKVQEKRGSINCNRSDANSYGKETTGADSSNRKETEDEDKEKPDKEDGKEPTGADSSNGREKVDDEKEKPDKCCDITNSNSRSLSNAVPGSPKTTSTEEMQISLNSSSKQQNNVCGFGMPCPQNGGKNKNFSVPIKVYYHQKRKISAENVASSSVPVTRYDTETSDHIKSNGNDGKVAGICIERPISSPLNETRAADCALVPYEANGKDAAKLQTVLATKEPALSETALRVLLQKIEDMCHQQRILEDKIALCRRDVQKIIEGNEDTLGLKLEAIIDCCNDACLKGETQIRGETYQPSEIHRRIQCLRRDRLSDTILTLQSPCQELDYICHVNKWRLPRYSVSASTGGFIASVTMKEMDFDFECEGALLSTPFAARESAAELMIGKLREMAGQTADVLPN